MSKNVVLSTVAFFLLSVAPCSAQTNVNYGAKVGANFSVIQTARGTSERLMAPAGGPLIKVDLSRTLALQTELLYMVKGDRDEILIGEQSADVVIRLDYLELPLLLKLQAPLLGNAEAGLYGGIAPALKIREELEDPRTDRTVDNLVKNVDVGVSVGMEFGFNTRLGQFVVDARMTPGITEIAKGSFLSPDSNNHTFTLMAGFILGNTY